MSHSILLVSTDPSLVKNVGQAIALNPSCRLVAKTMGEVSDQMLTHLDPAVLLIHLAAGITMQQALQLMTRRRPTIVISDHYDTAQALAFLKRSALDYLGRPVDLNRLATLLSFATWRKGFPGVTEDRSEPLADGSYLYDPRELEVCELLTQVRAASSSSATILLRGETGTGKTHLAKIIHQLSDRQSHHFALRNCATLVPSLMESELFGHAKGAFTGAASPHTGIFEEAGKGTILLDEIDALSLESQAKLLKVLDERVFERVGGNAPIPFRARLIVATNRDLKSEVAAGRFRKDLFYRINVVCFEVPPLRRRAAIMPDLVRKFIQTYCTRDGIPDLYVDPDAMDAITRYEWPGNIRELRNVIERAVALDSDGVLGLDDLPKEIAFGNERPSHLPAVVRPTPVKSSNQEASFLRMTLERCGNNRAQVARELGVSRPTLYKKLHKYGFI